MKGKDIEKEQIDKSSLEKQLFEGTIGAWNYAIDINNGPEQVEANWWYRFSDYRFREWRHELDELTAELNISLQDICSYLGVTYRKGVGFYDKLPKKRDMYIGIGMALKQPLETINQWITRFGMKRKLYVKNLEEDLPWIYLINANYQDRKSNQNYYLEYEACRRVAHQTYLMCWEDGFSEDQKTQLVETDLSDVRYDSHYESLKQFVMWNMDSFKTAYVKPRTLLRRCFQRLIDAGSNMNSADAMGSMYAMRGYLDDSMINYLSGNTDTINVIDMKSGARTLKFKHIPKSKKTHIALALALGMSRIEIDQYLTMMGFAQLDAVDVEEGLLLNALESWEQNHPLPARLRAESESGKNSSMSSSEKAIAVQQMLDLRQDLQEIYRNKNRAFPYLK